MVKKFKFIGYIMFLILIFIILVFNMLQCKEYIGTVIGIDKYSNKIYVSSKPETLESATNYDVSMFPGYDYTYAYVLFSDYVIALNDVVIKNIEGKRIGINDLNIGDNLYVIYKEGKVKSLSLPIELNNIKIIKVIDERLI